MLLSAVRGRIEHRIQLLKARFVLWGKIKPIQKWHFKEQDVLMRRFQE